MSNLIPKDKPVSDAVVDFIADDPIFVSIIEETQNVIREVYLDENFNLHGVKKSKNDDVKSETHSFRLPDLYGTEICTALDEMKLPVVPWVWALLKPRPLPPTGNLEIKLARKLSLRFSQKWGGLNFDLSSGCEEWKPLEFFADSLIALYDLICKVSNSWRGVEGAGVLAIERIFTENLSGDAEEYVNSIKPGDELILRREPIDQHAKNAVSVCNATGRRIGYIPQCCEGIEAIVAKAIDAGIALKASFLGKSLDLTDSDAQVIVFANKGIAHELNDYCS